MIDWAAAKKRESTGAKVQQTEPQFSKEQIVASDKYRSQRDLVDALLEEDKKYTIATVDKMIEEYRKGKVK